MAECFLSAPVPTRCVANVEVYALKVFSLALYDGGEGCDENWTWACAFAVIFEVGRARVRLLDVEQQSI